MYGAIVKLDALTDTNGAGTKNENLLLSAGALCLALSAVNGVIVRGVRLELCRAGIYHLVDRANVVVVAKRCDLCFLLAGESRDDVIRELHTLCFLQKRGRQLFSLEGMLHLRQDCDLINKPKVDLGDLVNLFFRNALAQCLRNDPDSLVIHNGKALAQLVRVQLGKIIAAQAVHVLLQGTDGFHQRTFEVIADAHDLTGCLHLRRQRTLSGDEFIKGQARDLYYAVVQRGLEASISFLRNGVLDLVQGITKRDLCSHLCDGVTGRLTCERGGTAHARVNLDDAVLKARGMQGELYVTATGDLQLGNDLQCGGTEHLILLIAQGLGRSHNDTVAGVHADGVDVLHVADGDAVAGAVAHYLVLNFLPAGDAALYEHLSHSGKTQTVLKDLLEFHLIVCDAAAAAA